MMYRMLLASIVFLVPVLKGMDNALQDPLIEAIRVDDQTRVVTLLEEGADVDAESTETDGVTPLICAALFNRTRLAKLLIARGVKVNVVTCLGLTPLHLACEKSNGKIVSLLLEQGAEVNACHSGHTALDNAVAQGDLGIIKQLIDAGADVNLDHWFGSTLWGAPSGHYSLTSTAGALGSPLCAAIRLNRVDIAALLLAHGADVQAMERAGSRQKEGEIQVLARAYQHGNLDMIKLLKEYGAVLTNIQDYLLFTPSADGNKQAVALLVSAGIDLERVEGTYQATPLLWAANNCHKEVCTMLLEAGAKPHAINKNGKSAIDCVEAMINQTIVKVLERSTQAIHSLKDRVLLVIYSMRLVEYSEIQDLINYYQHNPRSLKDLCTTEVRKLIKTGAIQKPEVLVPAKFDFEQLAIEEPVENLPNK